MKTENEEKHAGGRPLKFPSVQILQELIERYFKDCEENKKPLTITGLAIALDTSRKVLVEYENKDEFSNTIKKAKQMCEQFAEERLYSGGTVAGVIFNLKNNWGWKDVKQTEIGGVDGESIPIELTVTKAINKVYGGEDSV